MATFHFDLVSPEKVLFSGEVSQVDVPGSEGDFGVLAAHAPLVTTLRPGILVIYSERDAQRIMVDGGFAEVGPAGRADLAGTAVRSEEDTAELPSPSGIVCRLLVVKKNEYSVRGRSGDDDRET